MGQFVTNEQLASGIISGENCSRSNTASAAVYPGVVEPALSAVRVCEHFSHRPLAALSCLNLIPGFSPVESDCQSFDRLIAGKPVDEVGADESFDLVICDDCYQEEGDMDQLAFDVFRLLKPGGFCYFAGLSLISRKSDLFLSGLRGYSSVVSIRKAFEDFWIHDYVGLIQQSPALFGRGGTRRHWYHGLLPSTLHGQLSVGPSEFVWVLTKKR